MHTPRQRIDLFETRRGHVFYCPSCRALHAQMGNAVLTCRSNEFERFRAAVNQSCREAGLSTAGDGQTRMICWDSPSMGFAFSKGELFELRFLLEGAAAMLRRHPAVQDALAS